jgi:hypothetical protein
LAGRAIGRSSIGTIPGNNRQLFLPAMPYEPHAVSKPTAAVATAAATPIAHADKMEQRSPKPASTDQS